VYKYSNFTEYIQLNYLNTIKQDLEEFIKLNELVLYSDDGMHQYDDFEILKIVVVGVVYTKNQKDKVEFDVIFKAEYRVSDSILDASTGFPPFYEKKATFRYGMVGSFKKGFIAKNDDDIEKIVEDQERLTSSLVPVISTEEMDSYATKLLKEFCPEALETPMKLNVHKMLSDKGITVHYAPLDDCIFGKTYFAKDKAIIYKENENGFFDFFNSETEEVEVGENTILINFDKAIELPSGAYRNTIVHELVHWFYHSNYFELRQLLNDELTCAVCCKGIFDYENDDIAWMEWQARSIAPRVLMPKKTANIKWKEIYDEIKEEAKEKEYSKADILEKALKKFAKFFEVSEASARIRLKELGFTEVEGVNNYFAGSKMKSFFYKKNSLSKNQTYLISQDELCTLLRTNIFLQSALLTEKVFYINNMIVVNNPKYVDVKKFQLTDYALDHIDECCFKFDIERFGITSNGEVTKNYLLSTINNRRESKDFSIDDAGLLLTNTDTNYSHYMSHKKELPDTFGETIEYHYKKAKTKKRINSYLDLEYASSVSEKQIREYKDGNVDHPKRATILKIALALNLSVPYIMDLLEKGDCALTFNNSENTLLLTTLIAYPRVGLIKTYEALQKVSAGYLLEIPPQWLKDNDLD